MGASPLADERCALLGRLICSSCQSRAVFSTPELHGHTFLTLPGILKGFSVSVLLSSSCVACVTSAERLDSNALER